MNRWHTAAVRGKFFAGALVLQLCFGFPFSLRAASGSVMPLDSDGDGLADSAEDRNENGKMDSGETDLFNADTDGGGEADGAEVSARRDPFDRTDDFTYDLDHDGLTNGEEWILGTDPANPDTDDDGLNDLDDPFPLSLAHRTDENHNGVPDEVEAANPASPVVRPDADTDGDGLTNGNEYYFGTDPSAADTDGDGMPDGAEIAMQANPRVNVCLGYADAVAAFADMRGHWAHGVVSILHRTTAGTRRIVDGYGTGRERSFRPDQPITRFELMKMALLGNCALPAESAPTPSRQFTDLSALPPPDETAAHAERRTTIYAALGAGIIQGYPDGTVRPDAPVNRAEALKILLRSARMEEARPTGTGALRFPDVPEGSWFAPYVEQASARGAVEGYADGTFRPAAPITRAEAGKLLLIFLHLNPAINGDAVPLQ